MCAALLRLAPLLLLQCAAALTGGEVDFSAELSAEVEAEIAALEPDLTKLLELSTQGAEKGKSWQRTADFCDRWGHRISGSKVPRAAKPSP